MKPNWEEMTQGQVVEWFANRLGHIYTTQTAGDFTYTGVLFEFHWAMAQAKV